MVFATTLSSDLKLNIKLNLRRSKYYSWPLLLDPNTVYRFKNGPKKYFSYFCRFALLGLKLSLIDKPGHFQSRYVNFFMSNFKKLKYKHQLYREIVELQTNIFERNPDLDLWCDLAKVVQICFRFDPFLSFPKTENTSCHM